MKKFLIFAFIFAVVCAILILVAFPGNAQTTFEEHRQHGTFAMLLLPTVLGIFLIICAMIGIAAGASEKKVKSNKKQYGEPINRTRGRTRNAPLSIPGKPNTNKRYE